MASDNEVVTEKEVVHRDHAYCVTPTTALVTHQLADENEALRRKVEELQQQVQSLQLQSRFGLQHLQGSDEDIRFYTRLVHAIMQLYVVA